MLKLGALALLLIIDGALAEQRPQAFPTVDFASTLRHTPHRRHGLHLAHHAPVRTLLSSNSRRSLLSTGETCAWNADSDECSLSIAPMKNLLEESDTDFAQIVIQHLECLEKTNREDCNNEEVCLWSEGDDECLYLEYRRNHEDSPCAKAAPLVFDHLEAIILCLKEQSRDSCEANRQCIWSSDFDFCRANQFFIVFGIENFQEKVAQVLDDGREAIFAEYRRQMRRSNFTWDSFSGDQQNSIECPSDIEPLVCTYANAAVPIMLGTRFYCSERHESSFFDCETDVLCTLNTTSLECDINPFLLILNSIPSSPAFTDMMPDGLYRRSTEAAFACSNITERRSCRRTCVWNRSLNRCEASPQLAITMLVEEADNSTDALCTYLNVTAQSECNAQSTRRQCRRREFCYWAATSEDCRPTAELYLSAASDLDSSLENRYKQVTRQCSGHSRMEECLAESNDDSSND